VAPAPVPAALLALVALLAPRILEQQMAMYVI
jgi:hypothetical protein